MFLRLASIASFRIEGCLGMLIRSMWHRFSRKLSVWREMRLRNAGDRVVSSQVAHKLKQVQAQLAAAEAAAASSSQAVHAKDAQKKWMKF